MGVHPQRHREQLIRGLDDDGLEELTLRLARKQHPDAHRTGRGRDSGIDVLSDYERPPAAAWQSKTSTKGEADWDKCRASIKAAMSGSTPPRRYTFVFNHALSAGQRNFWRDTLLPELRGRFPSAERIDYWDDLDRQVEKHPELIAWLTDGAYGTYVRSTLEQTAATGINPVANAVDLSEGLTAVAEHAREIGRTDPRFAYGSSGREADATDAGLADRVARFTMTAGQRHALPSYELTIRDGDLVHELTARPRRESAQLRPPEPWFADDDEGRHARALARAGLAKGRPVSLTGVHVGVSGGDVPDRFADWMNPESTRGRETLELGVSEALELVLTLSLPDVGDVKERIAMYRVPPEAGAEIAYAGAVGGAVLAIDVVPGDAPKGRRLPQGGKWVECAFTVTLAIHDEPSQLALRGLGFAQAFGTADYLHFDCPGLLPQGGYEVHGTVSLGTEEAESWMVAATVALALDGLSRRDGVERFMPEDVTPRDVARAQVVLRLLADEAVAVAAAGEFPVPLPPSATLEDDPADWLSFVAELPPLVGQPTGLQVEQELQGATPLRIERAAHGSMVMVCLATSDNASIVMRAITTSTDQ